MAHLNHLGSIVFGALIIAIIKVITFIFVYVAKKAVSATGAEDSCWGKVAKCLICVGACILRCLEKIADYINNVAFAYQAVTGDWFCFAAKNGFFLNLKHAAAFATSRFFAKCLMYLGKAGITALNVYTCYFMIVSSGKGIPTTAPCVVVGVLSWYASEIWLSIFDYAVLGIMTSYAVDYDFNLQDLSKMRGPETFGRKLSTMKGV